MGEIATFRQIGARNDGTINLADYALLVDMWLDELLWP
jgi:hypothetical protein